MYFRMTLLMETINDTCWSYLFQEVVEYVTTNGISLEVEVNVHVLSKSAGIVISICPCISKTLEDSIWLEKDFLHPANTKQWNLSKRRKTYQLPCTAICKLFSLRVWRARPIKCGRQSSFLLVTTNNFASECLAWSVLSVIVLPNPEFEMWKKKKT